MIGFKEYALLNFQNIIGEKIRLFYLSETFYYLPYLFEFFNHKSEDLDIEDKSKAIQFFIKDIDSWKTSYVGSDDEKVISNPFLDFLKLINSSKVEGKSVKNYYDIAMYYLMVNGLPEGVSETSGNKKSDIETAYKEIFAYYTYKLAQLVENQKEQEKYSELEKLDYLKNIKFLKFSGGALKVQISPDKKGKIAELNLLNKPYGTLALSSGNPFAIAVKNMNEYIDKTLISLVDDV